MPKAVAIDTQLLLLLIVGLTDPAFIPRHKRTDVYDAPAFDELFKFVSGSAQIVCTAHILTETSNFLRQCADPMRTRLMHTFKGFIGNAQERPAPAVVVSESPFFLRLGLTDAAILSLDPAEIAILTVDHDLHIAAAERGFEVINMTPVFFK